VEISEKRIDAFLVAKGKMGSGFKARKSSALQ